MSTQNVGWPCENPLMKPNKTFIGKSSPTIDCSGKPPQLYTYIKRKQEKKHNKRKFITCIIAIHR